MGPGRAAAVLKLNSQSQILNESSASATTTSCAAEIQNNGGRFGDLGWSRARPED
jgi:hypothetical protein